MNYEILLDKKAKKFLLKFEKSSKQEHLKIIHFLEVILPNAENPCLLPNAKKLQGYSDNRYRWRIGDYRIIGIVENGIYKIIQIINISHRKNAYQ